MNYARLHILLADDRPDIRKLLNELLVTEFESIELTECGDGNDVIKQYQRRVWDFILLDISMPGKNGIDVMKQLRSSGVKAPIIIISVHVEPQYVFRVIEAGASGFINKNMLNEELGRAMQMILSGNSYSNMQLENQNRPVPALINLHDNLSDREVQVLQSITAGKSISTISHELSLNMQTLSKYREAILFKLQLKSNEQMSEYAITNGLVV